MQSVRVVLVAPHMPDLAQAAEEIYAIERTSGLLVDRLPPSARRRELMIALDQRHYDVLWFATHGKTDGVWLNEDDLLPAGDLVALVRNAGLTGVVLNSCDSEKLAEMLHDAANVDVVCTVSEVADLTAFHTGVLFARALGKTGNFRAAFDAARPGGVSVFRYIPEHRESLIMTPEHYTFANNELRAIYEAINDIRQRLSVVETELRYVRKDLDRRRGNLRDPNQWWLLAIGIGIGAVLLALFYLAVAMRPI